MVAYEVYKDSEGDYRVKGLKSTHALTEDQLILHHSSYPETETPEVDKPGSTDKMHGALYDMYQWHDALKEGDTFTTPFGNFKCVSFHVVKDIPGRRVWRSHEGSDTVIVYNPEVTHLRLHTNMGWVDVEAELDDGETLEGAAERLAASYGLVESPD